MLSLVAIHPAYTLLPASFVLAYVSLSLAPAFVSLIALLTSILVYTREAYLLQKPGKILLLWLTLTASISLSNSQPSIHALSAPSTSIASLVLLSAISSLFALVPIIARHSIPASRSQIQAFIFPTLWTMTWLGVSRISPLGRLTTWHPLSGVQSYQWTLRFFGFSGIDWIVAAWASISAGVIENAIGTDETHTALVDVHPNVAQRPNSNMPKRLVPLTGFLLALTAPSFLSNSFPLPPFSSTTTPLRVACILPQPSAKSQLERFLAESAIYSSRAKILLWPEGAVVFETKSEMEDALEKVQLITSMSKAWIGVSFQERVSGSSTQRDGMHRNGLVLVGPGGPEMTYYKRNLVPIAESFSQISSNDAPSLLTIDLQRPNDVSREDWGEDQTRPISLSASICLDFAFPLTSLRSRPALILAPARTWHIDVGHAMYELARTRGNELGAEVLWCDGGEGGLSGVVGDIQVGPGSWVKAIGVPYPTETHRTLYGICGDWLVLAAFLGVPGFIIAVQQRYKTDFSIDWGHRGRRLLARIRALTQRAPQRAPPQIGSLIDAPNDPIGS